MKIAMIGLGKMGANRATRLLQGGHQVVTYDLNETAIQAAESSGAEGARTLDEVAARLPAPRVAWVMVPSGAPTEASAITIQFKRPPHPMFPLSPGTEITSNVLTLHGDASFFTRGDRGELAWRLLDPILAAWLAGKAPLATYEPGSWGPEEADELLSCDGRAWLHGCAH